MPSSVSHVRVRYAETDKMGVVYYANYFVWFEVARADLLRSLGWSYREMELAGVSLPVIEAHCRYHRGARYDDELEVKAEGRMMSPGEDGVPLRGRPPRRREARRVGQDRPRRNRCERPPLPAAGAHPFGVCMNVRPDRVIRTGTGNRSIDGC